MKVTNKKVVEWLEVESENWIDLEEYPGVYMENEEEKVEEDKSNQEKVAFTVY